MKRKFAFAIIGLVIFAVCFLTSVRIQDYSYERQLKVNLKKISIGMPEKDVIEILGKPNHIWSSDTPSAYWCYDTSSIAHTLEEQPEIECGHMLLEMSSYKNARVTKVYDFK